MIVLRGHCYDGRTSARRACQLHVDDGGRFVLQEEDGRRLSAGLFRQLGISSRLGDAPRFIDFPGDLRLETADNARVDQLLALYQPRSRNTWLHRLESQKRFVLMTALVVIAFVWGMVRYGAPATAKVAAEWVPQSVLEISGEQALAALDKAYFDPSGLPEDVQKRLAAHFAPTLAAHAHLPLRVLFRASDALGPNALALPDGTIVFTDAMVRLAQEDDELLAVLAHEIGHVEYRHNTRRVIQDSILAFLLAVIAGDISGTSEFFLGLPVLLTEMAYSREFEREADRYARELLHRSGKSPALFSSILRRLEAASACKNKPPTCEAQKKEGKRWLEYFSTHPSTDERAT